MRDIRVCVAGADGRMGSEVLREAEAKGLVITGAVVKEGTGNIGKTLREAGVCGSDVLIHGASSLSKALEGSDIYISFTSPESELENLPLVVEGKKKVVIGTTGFAEDEMNRLEAMLRDRVPAVISPNFSVGVNVLFRLAKTMEVFPKDYDVSIFEVHHTGKADSPSGTAQRLGDIVARAKGYDRRIHGREGFSKRTAGELEILSARTGGVPGLHDIIVAGPHEMIRIEHTAFSRRAFAHGAVHAASWLMGTDEPGIYSMFDVLKL